MEIELIGQVADNKAFFDSLDIFVLSSRREGLPNVLLEAMAMEVPVVATGIAGIPRLIQSGANGILVPPDSVEELAGAMQKLMKEPELRKKLADAGRATIEHDYSFQRRMERVAAIYDQVLDRSPIRSLIVPSGDRIQLVPASDRVQTVFSSEHTGK
jgi:glycosyltransferase involved in cell wall biosynthesis